MTIQWSAVAAARHPVVDVIEELGHDLALAPGELSASARTDAETMRSAWAVYDRHFARFCGARLDPQFWRLAQPAAWSGMPIVTDAAPVIIVGTGPSMRAGLEELRRYRDHVHLFTSPRGADALEDEGLVPDVVLIEHVTPIDAQFSVQALSERQRAWRARVALILTDERTPASLVSDVPTDRLLALNPLPTWGLWPATATALAVSSGAHAVGLLGIDLGSEALPDRRQDALRDLLSLTVLGTRVPCIDLGSSGSRKTGWGRGRLASLIGSGARQPLAVARVRREPAEARRIAAATAWRRTAPLVSQALVTLDTACRVHDGAHSREMVARLVKGLTQLLARGNDRATRDDVQSSLGCSYLPRFWRTPPDLTLGPALWRPAALAAHELVHQHRALDRCLRACGVVA